MEKLIKVAINDLKLIFRDNSLKFFFVFPVLNLFVIRYGLPLVVGNFEVLKDYVSVIIMAASSQGSLIFGFIYSMVLVDEKDKQVAKVYGILPVSKFWFVIFRLIAPFLLSILAAFLLLLAEPFYELPIISSLLYSILAGLIAPQMALFVAITARNKIEAMTWQKLFNIPVSLPLLAFFVPVSFSFLFAMLPTHWAYQGFRNIIAGQSPLIYLLIGIVYSLLLVGLMARKFSKSHFS